MEIEEARKYAKDLEEEILQMLQWYQEDTGCYITDIHAFISTRGILKVGLDIVLNEYFIDKK